jgi:hypothetical protein
MKKAVLILIIILALSYTEGFSQGKKEMIRPVPDTVSADSTEYELIIIDPGFDTWFLTQPSREYKSQNYYEYWNRLYVSEWNYRYSTARDKGEYDSYIDYNPRINYGLDLNYKLYYYFKYFEEKNGTKLYPSFR